MVRSETSNPSFRSSPCIRGAPHVGFSRAMRRIRLRTSTSTLGRPRGRDFLFQYQRNPLLCHCTTVAGLTMTSAPLHFGHRFRSNTQNPRSTHVRCGRDSFSMRMANCCRRARFSMDRSVLDRNIDPTEWKREAAMLKSVLMMRRFYPAWANPSTC